MKEKEITQGGAGLNLGVNLAILGPLTPACLTFEIQRVLVDSSPWWICNSGIWIWPEDHLAFDGMKNMMVHLFSLA